MGNTHATSLSVPCIAQNNVTVSTRSEPIHGFVVRKECGIVVGNSRVFTSTTLEKENQQELFLQEAIQAMSQQAAALGANAVFGMSIDIRLRSQGHSVLQVSGTACVVEQEARTVMAQAV